MPARTLSIWGLALACAAALLAGWLPLGFSIVTVFLFAGPHNWIEARYFLTRLPARWGRLRTAAGDTRPGSPSTSAPAGSKSLPAFTCRRTS